MAYNRPMGALLKRRHITGFIVCLAMLLQWYAPAWASSAASTDTAWASEVCRSAPAKAPASTHSLKHCLYCASSSDDHAGPPSATVLPLCAANGAGVSKELRTPGSGAPHWHPAQPRAPPTIS